MPWPETESVARLAETSAETVAAGFSSLICGTRSVPPATVKARSVSPAAKLPAPARRGAKAATAAASMSRPILSASVTKAGNAPGSRWSRTSPFSAAVPEPDSAAIIASTDLPLADSAAESSPVPLTPASGRMPARLAPESVIWPEKSPVPPLFFNSNSPASTPSYSLALRLETRSPSASSFIDSEAS